MTSVRRISRLAALLLLTVLVATHVTESAAQSVQWSTFRGNQNRTGHSAVDGPRNPDLHWSFDLQAEAYSSPAIDEDGTVVVGTDGAVVSIRPDGTQRWLSRIGGNAVSSPLISLGSVFIGARDGRLYELNSTSGSVASVALGGEVWSSPIDIDGTVFVGAFGGRFFAVNQQDLSVRFSVPAGDDNIVSSPAVGTGLSLVFGSVDGNVYSVLPGGTIDWTFPTQGEVVATPAIGPNGDIRVGSRDGLFYHLSAAGSSVSTYNTGSDIVASAALSPRQQSFFGDLDGRFHGVSASGAALWQPFQADTSIISGAVLDGSGVLYFGTLNGTLYALD
ncbi:MAG: PQQ-binding-like beta-propeller repeat protein, partial [Rhodothermales bacterium]|nr:PQQ-binding-like beta-propeller repeat protein [Rhodothermales bacterium]